MTVLMPVNARSAGGNSAWPAETADLLTRVDALLREGQAREALDLSAGGSSPWARNARGVCLLRLGRIGEAITVLRDLVFVPNGFAVRDDAHPVFQANYAVALLLDGNADSFWTILRGIPDRNHPAGSRLDGAVRRWKAGMTFWQRIASALGIGGPSFGLDFPPGVL